MTADAPLEQVLMESAWLAGAKPETVHALARSARQVHYESGQLIALEGDECRDALWVMRGLCRARQVSIEGREHVLGYFGPGEFLNLAAVVGRIEELATLDAVRDSTVCAIAADRFILLLDALPELGRLVALALARDVAHLYSDVKGLALDTVRVRLARFLLAAASSGPGQHRWTQETIAAQLGTVRDVVGRLLRSFADEGLIRREGGQLVLLDRARLERTVQGL